MTKINENNQAEIFGIVESGFTLDHTTFGESFYSIYVSVRRNSGVFDIIPVIVSERLIDVHQYCTGKMVCIKGQFRSYNKDEEGIRHLILFLFAREITFVEDECDLKTNNRIFINGYICKTPTYRRTALGREITDLILAVKRPYGKSDYIPCICWGRNARFSSELEVGTKMLVCGRIQSREYTKMLDNDEVEARTAYEVSINKLLTIETKHKENGRKSEYENQIN